jgi:hypothetical protein
MIILDTNVLSALMPSAALRRYLVRGGFSPPKMDAPLKPTSRCLCEMEADLLEVEELLSLSSKTDVSAGVQQRPVIVIVSSPQGVCARF